MGEEREIQSKKQQAANRINYICKEMQKARKTKGLSILIVSNASGIGYGYISDLENGKHKNIALHTIIRYCDAINEDYIALLTRAEVSYQINEQTNENLEE